MKVQSYLFFDGKCDEALEFYKRALGAKVNMLMRFGEAPDQSMVKPENKNKVMHSEVQIGDSVVMASDGYCNGKPGFQGFAMTIAVPTDAEAKRVFDAISEGGQVTMPLSKTFFASSFGTASDKYGVGWMVITEK